MSTEKEEPRLRYGIPSREDEEARRRRLSDNLAEGLALSEFIYSLPEDERPADHEALEVFRAAQKDAAAEG